MKHQPIAAVVGGWILAALPLSPVLAQDFTLGQLTLAGLADVCVPVIEQGDNLADTAKAAGFTPVSKADSEGLPGGRGMSWWMYDLGQALVLAGRNAGEAGSPCWVLASLTSRYLDGMDKEIADWLDGHRAGFKRVQPPQLGDRRDTTWAWERVGGGTVQQVHVVVSRQSDGSASAMLKYGLLPARR